MNKAQKTVILIASLFISTALIYPPFIEVRSSRDRDIPIGAGWDWIFDFKSNKVRGFIYIDYQKIRFDVLICEIGAILAFSAFLVFLLNKKKFIKEKSEKKKKDNKISKSDVEAEEKQVQVGKFL